MTEVYVVRNQLGHYWGKSKHWVNGSEPRTVMRAKHQDEAINTLFELSAKDVELRGEVLAAELTQRGEPVLEVSAIPVPLTPEQIAAQAAEAQLQLAAEPGEESTAQPNDNDTAAPTEGQAAAQAAVEEEAESPANAESLA